MIEQLPPVAVPQWLLDLTPTTMANRQFPLNELLRDSLYYPSSGFDGEPVKHLAGNIISFVYVDYGYTRDEFMSEMKNTRFRGYDPPAIRSVTEQELVPHGWHPDPPTPDDGDPSLHRDGIKEPFCDWCVFQRQKGFPANHGPDRFSLLYLCADGVAAFQALYVTNSVAPKAVAVIQPGHSILGGNWTDFTDPEKIFARSVLQNPGGRPEILLYGGRGRRAGYRKPCWPDYRTNLYSYSKVYDSVNRVYGNVGVWSL